MTELTGEIVLTYGIVVGALAAFLSGRIRVDAVSVVVMVALMVTDLLEVDQALSGFSNVATVTVAAMFILSEGLRRTGAMAVVIDWLTRLAARDERMALAALMVLSGFVSGFINNTAAVAVLIPAVIGLSFDVGISPSKLLMPLSFASMFGGVSTLIGTSTNLLVNSIAVDRGIDEMRMFEFTGLGLALFATGFVYLFVFGVRMIPARRAEADTDLVSSYDVAVYVSQVEVTEGAEVIGETLEDNALLRDLDVDVLEIHRGTDTISGIDRLTVIESGDILWVRGSARQIARLAAREGLALVAPDTTARLGQTVEAAEELLVEVVVTPDSQLEGRRVTEIDFPQRFGAQVLGLRQAGRLQEQLGSARLRAGNSLLLKVEKNRIPGLRAEARDFFVASEQGVREPEGGRAWLAFGIIVVVVALAALDVFPIVLTAIAGCVAMVGSRILSAEDAYESINWKIIFLLAGLIPLGVALEDTGGARLLADGIVDWLEPLGPTAVLAGLFLLTQLLTSVISNNAAAVLMTPIGIDVALGLGVDARPFLFAVAVAASMSFLTPIGYQTNTMIYGPGNYRFADFTRVGGPLTLLSLAVSTVLIPVIWPF